MKIVLASKSAVKVAALENAVAAFGLVAEIVPVSVPTGVPEQPIGAETAMGAHNRIHEAIRLHPEADMYVAIENGLFPVADEYYDNAVVVVSMRDGVRAEGMSDGVHFPLHCVEQARDIGFETMTVGKVMQAAGLVKDHADPHVDISGKSRGAYLVDALQKAFTGLANKHSGFAHAIKPQPLAI